jgi:hypothetical protein
MDDALEQATTQCGAGPGEEIQGHRCLSVLVCEVIVNFGWSRTTPRAERLEEEFAVYSGGI